VKTTDQALVDLERKVANTWAATLAGTSTGVGGGWPLRLPLGKPSKADLDTRFPAVREWAAAWRAYADQQQLHMDWEPRLAAGTRQPMPTHLTVPDLDVAARLLHGGWLHRLATARTRHAVLVDRFPHAATPDLLRKVTALTSTDFDLLCAAADWFTTHDATGLTPRQVPVPGLHGKWLNAHHGLIQALAGRDSLGLTKRPTRIHFTYLDPHHRAAGRRLHDSHTLGDTSQPVYQPRLVVITENKDTAILFPEIAGGIAVEGNGYAAPALLPGIDWIRTARHVYYWGDIDHDGYKIVNRLRANGLPVGTVLMDPEAYDTYARFGAATDDKGKPLPCPVREPLDHLTDAEHDVYARITDPTWAGPRRIEQERIPLDVAADQVRALLDQDRVSRPAGDPVAGCPTPVA
jgi:hypothetical protein